MANQQVLSKRIQSLAAKELNFDTPPTLAKAMGQCKRVIKAGRALAKERHLEGGGGFEVAYGLSVLLDEIITFLSDRALEIYRNSDKSTDMAISIIAIGGYGRAEICPLSDVDIMFLYPEKTKTSDLEHAQNIFATNVVTPLWDTGFKVGQSSRTMDDILEEARSDVQTKTSLLESRHITGSKVLYEGFEKSYHLFYRKEKPRAYIEQRIQDQKDRREKYGDSVFMQEPDIKNGVGGLRDYQNTLWMARVRLDVSSIDGLGELNYLKKDELLQFKTAYDFLLRTRNDLHFASKRPTDLLSLEVQPKIAKRLGYKERNIFTRIERFMRDYYQHAQTILEISKVVENRLSLNAEQEKRDNPLYSMKQFLLARRRERVKHIDGFTIRGNEISTTNPNVFSEDPARLIRVFRHKQQHDVKLDFELRALIRASLPMIDDSIRQSEDTNMSFRSILHEVGNVYPTLNSMHEHGVLGKFLPEWGRLTCLVQHEYFHRYTADIHILHTIRELDKIFSSPDGIFAHYRDEIHKLSKPSILYLILFLHDIGKAKTAKSQTDDSVEIAAPILDRLQIPDDRRVTILYIIKNHLEMARFWQRYDLDDPETAKAFAKQTETAQQLRLLYIHTFCDARGTANGLWNNYKNTLHSTLFTRTLEVFKTDGKIEQKQEEQKEMTRKQLLNLDVPGISKDEINAHFELLPDRYFINTSKKEIIVHIELINQLLKDINTADSVGALEPVINWTEDVNRSFTVINVVTWDRSGLFHKLAGALNVAGYSILSAKAISRDDHIAIDTFYVTESNRGPSDIEQSKKVFKEALNATLIKNEDLYGQIQKKTHEIESDLFRPKDNPLAETFQPRVEIYNELSLKRTILEVQAPDHLGLLYQIAHFTHKFDFDIAFARINTERGIAIDTLYLNNTNVDTEIAPERLKELRDTLFVKLMENYEPPA